MNLHLDRSLPISLIDQIKGQIAYAISFGRLRSCERLPSVRELAATLQVAPMTISQVYKELIGEGLVFAKPGVGTFVTDITRPDRLESVQASQNNLFRTIDACIRQALLLGYSKVEIRRSFLECLDSEPSVDAKKHLLMMGNFNPATESYAREIEASFSDLSVRVTPVLLDELRENLDAWRETLDGVRLVVTVPPRLQDVRALLRSSHCQVAAVAFITSPETRRRLAAIPPASRIGIVAIYPEFLHSLLDEVEAYGLSRTPPVPALLDQEERITRMLAKVDVVVYASGCEEILDWIPENVSAIEYRYAPELDSVNRLRLLID